MVTENAILRMAEKDPTLKDPTLLVKSVKEGFKMVLSDGQREVTGLVAKQNQHFLKERTIEAGVLITLEDYIYQEREDESIVMVLKVNPQGKANLTETDKQQEQAPESKKQQPSNTTVDMSEKKQTDQEAELNLLLSRDELSGVSREELLRCLDGCPPSILRKLADTTKEVLEDPRTKPAEKPIVELLNGSLFNFVKQGVSVYDMLDNFNKGLWVMLENNSDLFKPFQITLILESCLQGDSRLLGMMLAYKDMAPAKTVLLSLAVEYLSLECMDEEHNCPIHLACRQGHLDCVKLLVEKGRDDVNRTSSNAVGATALHAAVFGGHLDVVKYLVEKRKAKPNPSTTDGTTPLHLACARGHADVVHYLITVAGSNPFFGTHISSFEIAALFGQVESLRAVLKATCEEEQKKVNRYSSKPHLNQFQRCFELYEKKHEATGNVQPSSRRSLVEYLRNVLQLIVCSKVGPTDRDVQDLRRCICLKIVIEACPEHQLRDILSSRFRPNSDAAFPVTKEVEPGAGDTLLHIAARLGRGHCVGVLLDAGADITLRNSAGYTAIDCAMPHVANPTQKSGMLAVEQLIHRWENLRVNAESSMKTLLEDNEEEKAAKLKEKRRQKRARKKAKKKASSSNNNNNNNNKTKQTKGDRKSPRKKLQQPEREKAMEEESDAEDENDSSGSEQQEGDHDQGSEHGEMDTDASLKHMELQEEEGEEPGWILADGGKVRFPKTQAKDTQAHGTKPIGDIQKLDALLKDSMAVQQTTLPPPEPPTSTSTRENGLSETSAEKMETHNLTTETETSKTTITATHAPGLLPEAERQQQGSYSHFGPYGASSFVSGVDSLASTQHYHRHQQEQQIPSSPSQGLFFDLAPSEPVSHSSPFEMDSFLNLDQVMKEVLSQGAWDPTWSQHHQSHPEQVLIPQQQQKSLPSPLLGQGYSTLGGAEVREHRSMDELFGDKHPEAQALGIRVENLFGVGLNQLSVSQLDFLREMHLKQLNAVMEASVNNALEHGRTIAEEERRLQGTL